MELIFNFSLESCSNQQDYFDSQGNYWKTVCSLRTVRSKQASKTACEALQMTLASVDDLGDGMGILLNRANTEFTGNKVWVGGEFNGQCSVLVPLVGDTYVRTWKPCSEENYAYCEFNCKNESKN